MIVCRARSSPLTRRSGTALVVVSRHRYANTFDQLADCTPFMDGLAKVRASAIRRRSRSVARDRGLASSDCARTQFATRGVVYFLSADTQRLDRSLCSSGRFFVVPVRAPLEERASAARATRVSLLSGSSSSHPPFLGASRRAAAVAADLSCAVFAPATPPHSFLPPAPLPGAPRCDCRALLPHDSCRTASRLTVLHNRQPQQAVANRAYLL